MFCFVLFQLLASAARKEEDRSECEYGYHETEHENIIRNVEKAVFTCEHHTKKIDVLYHAGIEVFSVLHHFLHGPFIVGKVNFVKVTKEKKVYLFLFNVFLGECSSTDV